jgi:hypothetical protein
VKSIELGLNWDINYGDLTGKAKIGELELYARRVSWNEVDPPFGFKIIIDGQLCSVVEDDEFSDLLLAMQGAEAAIARLVLERRGFK